MAVPPLKVSSGDVQQIVHGDTLQVGAVGFYPNFSLAKFVGFTSPASVSSSVSWVLPSSDGLSGQVLTTNGAGTLSWQTVSGGGPILPPSFTYSRDITYMQQNWPLTLHEGGIRTTPTVFHRLLNLIGMPNFSMGPQGF